MLEFSALALVVYLLWLGSFALRAKRGLFNVQAQELKNTFTQATQGLESLLQGDGTGTLDQIPSTATITSPSGGNAYAVSIAGLNNAFQFQDQQTVQVYSAVGSSPTYVGTFTVSYTDPVTQTIIGASAASAFTISTEDYLVVVGQAGRKTARKKEPPHA